MWIINVLLAYSVANPAVTVVVENKYKYIFIPAVQYFIMSEFVCRAVVTVGLICISYKPGVVVLPSNVPLRLAPDVAAAQYAF